MATLPDVLTAPAVVEAVPEVSGPPSDRFAVHLDNFEGPFDLLLSLIAKHKLDITQIALAQVTDEFIAYIRAADRDLGTTSEFLLVAATLLDLKAARLLPAGDVDDTEDLELLEARDLLFVRLLQYRAYKQLAGAFAERLAEQSRRVARAVPLEPQLASLLPELVWTTTPQDLADLAARALAPKAAPPTVDTAHLHSPMVSVRDQAAFVVGRLRAEGALTFRSLAADAGTVLVVVGRFLALLELFREGVVAFDQMTPLGELTVRWTGTDDGAVVVGGDFDDELGSDLPFVDEADGEEAEDVEIRDTSIGLVPAAPGPAEGSVDDE